MLICEKENPVSGEPLPASTKPADLQLPRDIHPTRTRAGETAKRRPHVHFKGTVPGIPKEPKLLVSTGGLSKLSFGHKHLAQTHDQHDSEGIWASQRASRPVKFFQALVKEISWSQERDAASQKTP